MTAKQDNRLTKIEESLYRVAHQHESTNKSLVEIKAEQAKAAECRDAMRDSVLDLKGVIVDMRDTASKERAALTTQLTLRVKPGALKKVVTAAVTALVMAVLAFFATKTPEATLVVSKVLKVVQ